ncbi:hypothetical protein D3C87_1571280 [compost metagenome]
MKAVHMISASCYPEYIDHISIAVALFGLSANQQHGAGVFLYLRISAAAVQLKGTEALKLFEKPGVPSPILFLGLLVHIYQVM